MTTTQQWEADSVDYDTVTRPGDDYEEFTRSEFGGLKIGAAFFGWLCAQAVLVLVLGLAGVAVALTGFQSEVEQQVRQAPETASIVAAGLLLVVLMLAYFCGGYVAGRLGRFDGRRQAFAAWLLGMLVTGGLVAAGVLNGVEVDVPAGFDVELSWNSSQAMIGGLVALGVSLVMTLLFALAGGKSGERFHRRVDRALLNL